ncbi:glycosyltransferase 87 family protein [Streptomyces iconiensis]|uniref:Glycosyltransferase 87 family protein n=1 Tax=Streptomyces iconiensis TaxID=1384038 RepID=A0ABT7A0Z1_9ACTN|nr:glycosyltransferase 87 family protein [Streptomyces iconiensis]MDJ1134984.1 glycosyltransferase 87 family protein [Streptomyces iconiensis]
MGETRSTETTARTGEGEVEEPRAGPVLPWRAVGVTAAVLVALAVRFLFLPYKSGDYVDYVHPWIDFIDQHGGLRALKYKFSNYNVPYLYVLACVNQLPVSPLVGIKLVSCVCEAFTALFAYRIIRMRHPSGPLPLIGALLVALLPTVILNGSAWGQAESLYAVFVLGGLHYLLRRQNWLGCAFFGIALAVKLQAVFVFPALLLLVLLKRVPLRTLSAIPGAYLLLSLPALAVGASPRDVFLIYLDQASYSDSFSVTAPSVHQFFDPVTSGTARGLWTLLTLAAVVTVLAVLTARRTRPTDQLALVAGLFFALLVPFLLPGMHERYFYLADVLSVVVLFRLPWGPWSAVPVLVQCASFFSYLPFLLMPYRARDALNDPSVADRYGYIEPITAVKEAVGRSPGLLDRMLEPVIDFRVLALVMFLAVLGALAALRGVASRGR